MDPQLKALLLQTIYVAARSGQGATDPTYSTPASRSARVELRTFSVKSGDGWTKQTRYLVFSETSFAIGDRIWLPGQYTSSTDGKHRLITDVEQVVAENGSTSHYEGRC